MKALITCNPTPEPLGFDTVLSGGDIALGAGRYDEVVIESLGRFVSTRWVGTINSLLPNINPGGLIHLCDVDFVAISDLVAEGQLSPEEAAKLLFPCSSGFWAEKAASLLEACGLRITARRVIATRFFVTGEIPC